MEVSGRPRGLRVRTTCATEDEFVSQFHRRCDDESLFAPTEKMIPVDAECAFSLELSDGTPMLRGLGVVLGSWPTGDNPFGTAGVHVAIVQLTTGTQPLLERLVEARARADGTKVERNRRSPITQRRIAIGSFELEHGEETEEESVVRDVRHSITQEMVAAAPIEMIDERASHTIRYEGPLRAPAAVQAARMPSGPTRPPAMPSRLPALPLAARPSAPAVAASGQLEPAALPDPPTYPGPIDMRESQTVPDRPPFARGTPLPPDGAPALESSTAEAVPAPRRRGALYDTSRVIAARFAPIRKRLAPITAQVTALPKRFFAAPATGAPWWRNGRVAAVFVSGILVGVLVSHASRPASPPQGGALAAATPAKCTPDSAASTPTMAAAATVAVATPSGTSDAITPAAPTKPAATIGKAAPPAKIAATAKTPAPAPAKIAVTAKTPAAPAPAKIAAVAKTPAAPAPAKIATTAKAPLAPPPAKIATTAKTPAAPAPAKIATTSKVALPQPPAKTAAAPPPAKIAATAKAPATPAPARTAAPAPAKTAATTAKPVAATPPPAKPTKPAAPKKGGCHSLDCI